MWTEVATVGYYYYYYKSTDLSDTLQKHANGALYKIMKVQRAYQWCSVSETTGETSES